MEDDPSAPAFRVVDGAASAASQIRAELLRAIVSLEMKPGTRVSELEIAHRYGVSRQPVREAVISLQHTGLLKSIPQRGTSVVAISMSQMLDARFVREAIEVAVVREAARHCQPRARMQLDAIIDQQKDAVARADRDAFFRSDEAFHRALCAGAGSDMAWESITKVKVHMDRVCSLTLTDAAAMEPLIEEHMSILRAIDSGAPDDAAAAMSRHLNGILSTLPKIEYEFPEIFTH